MSIKSIISPVLAVDLLSRLQLVAAEGIEEVIIAMGDFSRLGTLSISQGLQLARKAREWGIRPLLQWDLLMTEEVFQRQVGQLSPLLKSGEFHALRLQDAGALQWALERSDIPLHWIAETGNHNLLGLQKWVELIGTRLERLVLSCQIPREQLQLYGRELKIPLELLGLGPILLFYSPRHLLENFGHAQTQEIRLLASSEESAHKHFPVRSNRHGTFLFHQKHHWLLQYVDDLAQMGVTHLRLEVESDNMFHQALQLLQSPTTASLEKFQKTYRAPLIRGFYHRNKSHQLFPKLKNEGLEKFREQAIGEVIGVERGQFLGVHLREKARLEVGQRYSIQTPEGKEILFTLHRLQNPDFSPATCISGGLALIGHLKGVGPRSLVVGKANTS